MSHGDIAQHVRNAMPHGVGGARLHRLRRLPLRALTTCGALFTAAVSPAAVALSGAVVERSPGRGLAADNAVNVAAWCVALAAVIAFEPPRSASPLAYARQLRARFLELQSTFDADDRRRPREGKEKEDDRVPSEP
jgi:hypothetical protein